MSKSRETFDRGVRLSREGRMSEAATALAAAASAFRDQGDDRHLALALWRESLVRQQLGDPGRASRIGAEAAALWQGTVVPRASGAERLSVTAEAARGLADLSTLASETGDHDRAVALATDAAGYAATLDRDRHSEGPELRGTALHVLGNAQVAAGRNAEAASAVADARKIRERRAVASVHPSLADWELANTLLLATVVAMSDGRADDAANSVIFATEIASSLGAAGSQLWAKANALSLEVDARFPGILAGREVHVFRDVASTLAARGGSARQRKATPASKAAGRVATGRAPAAPQSGRLPLPGGARSLATAIGVVVGLVVGVLAGVITGSWIVGLVVGLVVVVAGVALARTVAAALLRGGRPRR